MFQVDKYIVDFKDFGVKLPDEADIVVCDGQDQFAEGLVTWSAFVLLQVKDTTALCEISVKTFKALELAVAHSLQTLPVIKAWIYTRRTCSFDDPAANIQDIQVI